MPFLNVHLHRLIEEIKGCFPFISCWAAAEVIDNWLCQNVMDFFNFDCFPNFGLLRKGKKKIPLFVTYYLTFQVGGCRIKTTLVLQNSSYTGMKEMKTLVIPYHSSVNNV